MKTIQHNFVEYIPEVLEPRKLYISMQFNAAIHLCPCGCGMQVSTPISPDGWKMLYDGVSVSLTPSIGNWGFECKSHYWIRNDKIEWAPSWSEYNMTEKKAKRSWFRWLRRSS